MFKAIAKFFVMLEVFFNSITRLANATDHLAATAEERAEAFRKEQSLENSQRLEMLKAKTKHLEENPVQYNF